MLPEYVFLSTILHLCCILFACLYGLNVKWQPGIHNVTWGCDSIATVPSLGVEKEIHVSWMSRWLAMSGSANAQPMRAPWGNNVTLLCPPQFPSFG